RREDDADRLSGVLGICVAGAGKSLALPQVDGRNGALRPPQAEELIRAPYAPFPAAAASPRTMFTSVPLPTPSTCAAAPRLAAISRKPMLPRIPNTSPGAPSE